MQEQKNNVLSWTCPAHSKCDILQSLNLTSHANHLQKASPCHPQQKLNNHALPIGVLFNKWMYFQSLTWLHTATFRNFSSQVSRCWQPLGVEGACAWGCCPCCQGGAMPFMPFVATGGAGGGMLSLGSGNFAGLVWSASGAQGLPRVMWWRCWWYHDTHVMGPNIPYCWWKKSCTSWYGKHPIIYKVLYIPGGAGWKKLAFVVAHGCPLQTEIENVLNSLWHIPINASIFFCGSCSTKSHGAFSIFSLKGQNWVAVSD